MKSITPIPMVDVVLAAYFCTAVGFIVAMFRGFSWIGGVPPLASCIVCSILILYMHGRTFRINKPDFVCFGIIDGNYIIPHDVSDPGYKTPIIIVSSACSGRAIATDGRRIWLLRRPYYLSPIIIPNLYVDWLYNAHKVEECRLKILIWSYIIPRSAKRVFAAARSQMQ